MMRPIRVLSSTLCSLFLLNLVSSGGCCKKESMEIMMKNFKEDVKSKPAADVLTKLLKNSHMAGIMIQYLPEESTTKLFRTNKASFVLLPHYARVFFSNLSPYTGNELEKFSFGKLAEMSKSREKMLTFWESNPDQVYLNRGFPYHLPFVCLYNYDKLDLDEVTIKDNEIFYGSYGLLRFGRKIKLFWRENEIRGVLIDVHGAQTGNWAQEPCVTHARLDGTSRSGEYDHCPANAGACYKAVGQFPRITRLHKDLAKQDKRTHFAEIFYSDFQKFKREKIADREDRFKQKHFSHENSDFNF